MEKEETNQQVKQPERLTYASVENLYGALESHEFILTINTEIERLNKQIADLEAENKALKNGVDFLKSQNNDLRAKVDAVRDVADRHQRYLMNSNETIQNLTAVLSCVGEKLTAVSDNHLF